MYKDWNKKFRTAVSEFRNRYKNKGNKVEYYSYKKALEHLGGPVCKCYLTGHDINILTDAYALDHVIPVSKGGNNKLNNMNITLPIINQMKSNLTVDELLYWCKEILEYHGYTITQKRH